MSENTPTKSWPTYTGTLWVATLVLALLYPCVTARAGSLAPAPDRLDQALINVAFPQLRAASPWCRATVSSGGFLWIGRDQFAGNLPVQFTSPAPLAVTAIAPDSAAERAGLQPGTGIWGIGETPLAQDEPGGRLLYQRAFDRIGESPSGASLRLSIEDTEGRRDIMLEEEPLCAIWPEVHYGGGRALARTDGVLLQISESLVRDLSQEQLAALFAHELAHHVLEHRRRKNEAGVDTGLLSEFGHSGQLARRAEVEADLLSVFILARARFDPMAGPRLWRSSTGRGLAGGFFTRNRAYPAPELRAELMEAAIEMAQLEPGHAPDPAALLALRHRALDDADYPVFE